MRRLRGHISRPQEKPQSATTGGGREGVGWVQNVGAGGVKCMGGATFGSCWASVGRGDFECFLRVLFLLSGEPLLTPHLSLRGNARTQGPQFPPTRKATIRIHNGGGGRDGYILLNTVGVFLPNLEIILCFVFLFVLSIWLNILSEIGVIVFDTRATKTCMSL